MKRLTAHQSARPSYKNRYGQAGGPLLPPPPKTTNPLLQAMYQGRARWAWEGFKPLPPGYTQYPLFGKQLDEPYPWPCWPLAEPPPSMSQYDPQKAVPFTMWDPVTGHMAVGCSPSGWDPEPVTPLAEHFLNWVMPQALDLHPDWEPTWVRTQLHPGWALKTIQNKYLDQTVQWSSAYFSADHQGDGAVSGA